MKFLVVVSALLAVACAKPGLAPVAPIAYSAVAPAHSFGYSSVAHHGVAPVHYTAPVAHAYSAYPYAHAYSAYPYAHGYHAYPYAAAVAPIVAPVVEKIQYHAQDSFGQASYGHAEAYQSHNAFQDAAGNKVGAYSYVAPTGEVISTEYVADSLGFRVKSNGLPVHHAALPVAPVDTPEVAAAKDAHLKAFEEVKSRSRRAAVFTPYVASPYVASPYVASPYAYSAYHTPVVSGTTAYNTNIVTPFSHTSSFAYKHY